MSTIQFRPESEAWRRAGRPKVEIPQDLADALERTYRDSEVAEIEGDDRDEKTYEAIRMMRLYCKRQDKILDTQFFDRDGKTWVRFKMRDPRKYSKTLVSAHGRIRR